MKMKRTYVIKAAARVWKKRAIATVSPERYPPRRLQSARKPVKRPIAPKKRAMR
jgi:hypothetical protein